ncbi:MAG: histidinol-phosphate transaminase [Armatimonadetes bacterium]|nr:histidinol-phosphate transaminase [Armatimonadota bacterium]
MALSDLVNENICRLKPYSPGKPIEEVEREYGIKDPVKLASNENPLGPSPKAVEAMRTALQTVSLYPDGACYHLKKELASHWGVGEDMLCIGNGSDELIHYIGVTFLSEDDEVIQADPSFVRYESAAVLNDCSCIMVPLKDYTHDLDAMADRINDRTRLIFITNPNNPTGTMVTARELERFMLRVPERALVIFDEAYYEYVERDDYPNTLNYVMAGRNAVILRTFSKVYGLAGLRVGYGIARPEIIQCLNQVREPFNVNSIAQVGAVASLRDPDQVARTRRVNSEGKKYLYREFEAMGLPFIPTEANFVMFDTKKQCRPLFEEMLRRGVILRTGDIFGMPTWFRVTIGTQEENERFVTALREVLTLC